MIPSAEEQPTVEMLIKSRGLKLKFIGEQFGYKDYSTWYRKLKNIESWSINDIRKLAIILHIPPVEVFKALYAEVYHASIHTTPESTEIEGK